MNELQERILKLKKEKDAIILAHSYQTLDIQQIADFTGDSLQLSIQAAETDKDLIIFCGVRFMAETAKILKPDAKVVLPVEDAGCPMADMITAQELRDFKAEHPGAVVVCYVNSTAEVKAESDICCTSSNAVTILKSIPAEKEILFVPDQNLGKWAAAQCGRDVIVWDGYCLVHHFGIKPERIIKMREKYPEHKIVVHPECTPAVTALADKVASTAGMVKFTEENEKVIIGTEVGLFEQLKSRFPEKDIVVLAPDAICRNMKKTKLIDVWNALSDEMPEIILDDEVIEKSRASVEKMMELSR
ncbi:MAG: quinolinate synthase NadA [Candidatus Cloacimonetes bacterium]|nr:quinolinate synthase NadA [Candidatus Cloacimonadota bacterium]